MKKIILSLLIILTAFFLFACTGESFADVEIIADSVTDVAEGTYTLRYSIADYDKYNEKFSLDIQVTAFDKKGEKVEVANNRTMEIKKDEEYTVTILLSAIVNGSVQTKNKTFTVTAEKTPRKVIFYVGTREYKNISVNYGESLDIDNYSEIPDMYTLTGSGVIQTIESKKWVVVSDGVKTDLQREHLINITEDVNIHAEYEYTVTYTDITISFDNGEGEETPSITQLAGTVIAMPKIPEREGYIFDGWYKDKEYKELFSWKNYKTNSVLTDTVLYAKWLENNVFVYEQYFNYTLLTDEDEYPYYLVSLRRDIDTPTDIYVPVGHNNVPVRGFERVTYGDFYYGAFEKTNVETVVLPESLSYSSTSAFKDCKNLVSVTFTGNLLTAIGINAFYGCTALTEITVPEGVTLINTEAFYGCSSLTTINLPETISQINSKAFGECTALKEIVIPDRLPSLRQEVFSGCSALEKVVIGVNSKLNYIARDTFSGCVSLHEITLPYSFKNVGSLDEIFKDLDITVNFHQKPEE